MSTRTADTSDQTKTESLRVRTAMSHGYNIIVKCIPVHYYIVLVPMTIIRRGRGS